ncbi:sodium:solute symporter family protein [uncultured Desulfuromusa sp.]|uniref:sodium:solute symporter family protein n=1 Tax=uncultured Desulfuromusa sp. TaxID=219183 RepID=UPI002AA857ED|nr:sodium:solute symporter family protein [uncultured Desulfuromusa sp.]
MVVTDSLFLLTFILTLVAILFLASGRRTKATNSGEFSLGGRQGGAWHVFGAITGTLVGGASTVGTAQLAFLYGFSAWWFTLGAGLACLFLGLFLAVPLRRSQVETIPEFIARYHGPRARLLSSLFAALGMFIQIVAQLLACGAVLAVLFDLSLLSSAMISALLVILFTLSGGMKSAGLTGMIKMALIYLTMIIAGVLAYHQSGGWGGLKESFPDFPWFSLFGYGVKKGVSDLVSMLVGVISTQTYLQAVFSARNGAAARGGALLSAVLIPPLGIFGIFVGLYMRQAYPEIESALALPTFISMNFPSPLAGVAFATLLIAAVGTAAGLALGVATTLKVDTLQRWMAGQRNELLLFRLLTVGIVATAFVLLLFNLGTAIMDWSFLSMGLRGATFCFPLLFAIFLSRISLPKAGLVSIICAPVSVVVTGLLNIEILPPLYIGLSLSLLIFLGGLVIRLMRGDSS